MVGAVPRPTQHERILIAEVLEAIVQRFRTTNECTCETYSTPMTAGDLLTFADAMRSDYDGGDVELARKAAELTSDWWRS